MMVLKHRRDSMPKNTETQQWVVDESLFNYVTSALSDVEKALWDFHWDLGNPKQQEIYSTLRDLKDYLEDIYKGEYTDGDVWIMGECPECGQQSKSLHKLQTGRWVCNSCKNKIE
jgi:hypothetical protein